MAFKKLTAPTLTDLFVEELKRMILSGELKIGEKLPTERQLAQEMNVSLAVINAGINRLTALGFIRVAPRKGLFVADYIRNGNIDTMMEMLSFSGSYISHDLLDPISNLRRSIETGAARLACKNRSEEQLATMSGLLTQISEESDPELVADYAFHFFHEMTISSDNPYYPMICMSFHSVYQFFFRLLLSNQAEKDRLRAALQTLYDAIAAQDEEAAEHAVLMKIEEWLEWFELSGKIIR